MKIPRIGASFLLLGLALTACGASTPPPPAQAQVITSINGVASNASTTPVNLTGGGRTLATTQTDASGHFTLDLPSDAAAAGVAAPLSTGVLSDLGCTGTLTNGDPAASGYEVASLKMGSASFMNATVSRSLLSRALRGKVYLYADRSTTLSGNLDCSATTGMPTTVTVNLNVSKGWNVLALSIDGSIGLGGISVSGRLENGQGAVGEVSTWMDQEQVKKDLGA
ncbi:hypothetical protein [Deinococcus ruber]|uniref:Lipoprotein n=1 Tax=Deinococcus ruber TaxID=1848197 RepID=A0A918F262_9DEIO|nr:hypothetical protein [Deinococcus ruber]GGQ94533.1 hypothetical protein GCM10008957_03360 [Deinococcus ruber]